ncbi:hypothetical protein BDU57DRAFT_515975 [Ampelomyces quisqualis]|uniref:Uncharacterized protein n=1 Tax=Ampelomyces quisqualis TaxID=50730 RepID=A0A6A5QMR4_AMPQU|nr:hypothetical protein BDU57DRAFT_515975 [Ampelomyces quisqualis]
MAREHITNDEFFTQLRILFEHNRQKGHGTVYLTQKRLTFDSASALPSAAKVSDDPLWDTHPENPLPILIRASNNKSSKKAGTDREDVSKIVLSTVWTEEEGSQEGQEGQKEEEERSGRDQSMKRMSEIIL